ncbi:MAG: hypothetical protein K8S99_14690 [Planctomycetes bacterium]|nr:hypothetical protein [Planctomycetota bacterium]
MKRLLICVCVLMLGTSAFAKESKELANNAALRYWQAITVMPEYSAEQRETIANFETVDLARARGLMLSVESPLRLMHRGAAIGPVAWGIDPNPDGPATLLPHLAKARQLARFALLRARVEFADQKWDEGITDTTDVIRMARHVGNHELLIDILVEYSIENMAIETLAANLGAMPGEKVERLSAALAAVPPRSTTAEAMGGEKRWTVDWMRARVKAGDQAGVTKTIAQTMKADGKPELSKEETAALAANMGALIDELAAVYAQAEKIVSLPLTAYDAAAQKFDSEIHQSTNILVRGVMPSVVSPRRTEFRTDARARMLTAAIALQTRGEEAFKAVKDPYGDDPFEKVAVEGGFELRSKLTDREGKPVTLRVGAK